VVSMVDDPQLIGEVMNAGADGFLGKSIAPEELGQAILAIRAGEVLVRYEPSGLLPLQPSPRLEGLTERQLDVLRLLAQGKSNKEIGRALDISHYTVRIHVSSLLRALDVPSRTAAAVKYRAALGHGDGE
ncbi:LuxR C-terminal-related transcriptional regulator, partial [Pseudomonas aeruginosa]